MSALRFVGLSTFVSTCSSRVPSSVCVSHGRRALGGFAEWRGQQQRQQVVSRRAWLLTAGIFPSFFCRGSACVRASSVMAEAGKNEEGPETFKYFQIWVSEDGESHIKECSMSGFRKEEYSSASQFVRDEFGGQPQKIVFTELTVGLEQPLHTCPQVQFVVTLSGSWYVKTTDGTKHVFKPGEVLFQDNTKDTPAKKLGEHYSGAVGDSPCHQFIVQFNRPPEVDNPNPF